MMELFGGNVEYAIASERLNLFEQMVFLERMPWQAGKTILDIGCGPGFALRILPQKRHDSDWFRSES